MLSVWLPLNGNLDNQGLSDGVITANGATVSNSGKFGECYQFNGSSSISIASVAIPSNTPEWSFCCWFCLSDTTTTTATCLFSERSAVGVAGYTIFLYPNNGNILIDDGKRSTFNTMSLTANTWYHLAVLRTLDGKRVYINGELKASGVADGLGDTTTVNTYGCLIGLAQSGTALTTGDQGFKGKMNDVRIYTHALSQDEIHRLSQGLVLHYPLARPGAENLLKDSKKMSPDIWRYWGNAAREFEGDEAVVKLTGTSANWSADIESPMNVDVKYLIPYASVRNKQVTFSCWLRANKNFTNNQNYFALRTESTATRTKYFRLGTFDITTEWKLFSSTVTVTDESFTSGTGTVSETDYFYTQMYCHADDVVIYTKGWKLELGDHATPWTPNPIDDEYAKMGLDDDIWYDVSGFKNNASVRYGELTHSSDTPKYETCCVFDGATAITLEPDLYTQFIKSAKDELTASIWAYKDDWAESDGTTTQKWTLFSCQESGGFTIYERGNGTFLFVVGTGASSNSYISKGTSTGYAGTLSPGWHMFTVTYNGLVGLGYIDGQLVTNTSAKYSTKTPMFYNTGTTTLHVGAEAGANSTYQPTNNMYWNGKLSDLRVYTTALSADEVLKLYNGE